MCKIIIKLRKIESLISYVIIQSQTKNVND